MICAPVIVRAASLMPVRAVGPIGSQYHGRAERIFIHGHARRYGLEKTEPFLGEGRPLFNAVCKLDLEGIVAKRLEDPYSPKTKWWKILNPNYSQKMDRAELFGRRYG